MLRMGMPEPPAPLLMAVAMLEPRDTQADKRHLAQIATRAAPPRVPVPMRRMKQVRVDCRRQPMHTVITIRAASRSNPAGAHATAP